MGRPGNPLYWLYVIGRLQRAWPSSAAVMLAAVFITACQARPAPAPATTAALARKQAREPERFPHDQHAQLGCIECHALDAVARGVPALPGAHDHTPCDRGACHQAAFLTEPGPLCKLCHDEVDVTGRGKTTSAPYPPVHGQRALPSQFSHKRHLDHGRMEKLVGFHVVCTDCHASDGQGRPGAADHAVCGRCHAAEAAAPGMPAMDRCAECHRPELGPVARTRRFIVDDLRFEHGNHAADRRGKAIGCIECHDKSSDAEKVGAHPVPVMPTCVNCHDDIDRTPSTSRMLICETCHMTRTSQLGGLAPRSHLPPLERPEDHTLAFSRDHAADVLANARRCARCHTFMSGQTRDTCDECHQVMRPTDHTVTWIEYDHGPAASARSDRCSVCHRGTFCVACHSQPPRSHFPLGEFGQRHAFLAQLQLRSCLTCHDPAKECAGCHTRGQTGGAPR